MPGSMPAGRLDVRTREFVVGEVPRPSPGPGEVLVRVAAAGICLSDVHLIEGQLSPLFLAGDEMAPGPRGGRDRGRARGGRDRLDLSRSTGTLPLADAAEGVERLAHKQGNPIRLVLTP